MTETACGSSPIRLSTVDRRTPSTRPHPRPEGPLGAGARRPLLGAERASVARALVHRRQPGGRHRAEVGVRQRQRLVGGARSPEAVTEDLQPVRRGVDGRRGDVVAYEQPVLRREGTLRGHRVPAHLGVGAEVDEPLRRQGFEDVRRAREGALGEAGDGQEPGSGGRLPRAGRGGWGEQEDSCPDVNTTNSLDLRH